MAEMEETLIRATIRGFSRAIILWLLRNKPMSGYEVVKELKRLTDRRHSSGVVYPLLYELEEEGLLKNEWIQRGRRRIKYYTITKEGLDLLNKLRCLFKDSFAEALKGLLGERLERNIYPLQK